MNQAEPEQPQPDMPEPEVDMSGFQASHQEPQPNWLIERFERLEARITTSEGQLQLLPQILEIL